MAKTRDAWSDVTEPAVTRTAPEAVVDAEPGRAKAGVVHCFVEPGELRRMLATLVAIEMAGAIVQAALG
jgi:hypothetical protein